MASITILNVSNRPIDFSIYYLDKNSTETLTCKSTAYFGPTKYETIEYPDDCTEIMVSVSIEITSDVFEHIVSLKIPSPSTKFYEFINDNDKDAGLFEINANNLKNISKIKFKNKTLNGCAIALAFDIGGKEFIQNKGISKNRGLTLTIPFNAKNLRFTVYTLSPSDGWIDLKTIALQDLLEDKCYELIRNPSTSNFLLKETCSSTSK
ncbi:hypothetical protein [Clostridium tarantellae]|uniref:Uncharacterized protein n=1 Tax=Clostridium tarantellae TaxID=39493 RepID=A0A6I1MVS0_9CLOT|nr:hypothetical protein [Clostridium tarantellae]MPQ44931.1 hypothetical protein [Clostridium tarantellae]